MRIGVRVSVAILVMLPLFLLFSGGWITTFAIALVGFGTGRAVEWGVFGPPTPAEPSKRALWGLALVIGAGLALLGAVKLLEYRLDQRRAEMVDEMQRAQDRDLQALKAAEAAREAETWRVEIVADGSLLSQGQPTTLETLAVPTGITEARIRTDPAVAYAHMIAVMNRIEELGVHKIAMDSR